MKTLKAGRPRNSGTYKCRLPNGRVREMAGVVTTRYDGRIYLRERLKRAVFRSLRWAGQLDPAVLDEVAWVVMYPEALRGREIEMEKDSRLQPVLAIMRAKWESVKLTKLAKAILYLSSKDNFDRSKEAAKIGRSSVASGDAAIAAGEEVSKHDVTNAAELCRRIAREREKLRISLHRQEKARARMVATSPNDNPCQPLSDKRKRKPARSRPRK